MGTDLDKAVKLMHESGLTLAAVKGDEVITSTDRGIKPLLSLYDGGTSLGGFSVSDKVIGKAAAMLYVLLGAETIYADVISRPALRVLEGVPENHGISVSFGCLTDAVRNRTNTGFCPMETAVNDTEDPMTGLELIRKKLDELKGGL